MGVRFLHRHGGSSASGSSLGLAGTSFDSRRGNDGGDGGAAGARREGRAAASGSTPAALSLRRNVAFGRRPFGFLSVGRRADHGRRRHLWAVVLEHARRGARPRPKRSRKYCIIGSSFTTLGMTLVLWMVTTEALTRSTSGATDMPISPGVGAAWASRETRTAVADDMTIPLEKARTGQRQGENYPR